MTVVKKDRRTINFRIQQKAFDMLFEIAEADNRTMTGALEVMIMTYYDNWRGSAGMQPRPDADRHKGQ